MNALFRRDYLYRFNTDLIAGIDRGDKLRYLKYNRTTKSYVFLKGIFKSKDEESIEIKGCLLRGIDKLHWVGYGNTNNVTLPELGKLAKPINKLTTTTRLITHSDQLELGKVYKFTRYKDTQAYISEEPMVAINLGTSFSNSAEFKLISDDYNQVCSFSWINKGLVKCELIE